MWDRRRLQLLLGLSTLVTLALVAGVAWSLTALLKGGGTGQTGPTAAEGRAGADEAGPSAATAGPLSTQTTGQLSVPEPQDLGPAQVATGFPPTPKGALAQLIAIDRRAIESVSVVTAQDVIRHWALPGGPGPTTWSGVRALAILLDSAGLPADGSPDLQIELRPAMARISDRSSTRATPCVDFVLTTSMPNTPPTRVAVADCQHVVLAAGRWKIAAGAEAASLPSAWPGSRASYAAGYRWIEAAP